MISKQLIHILLIDDDQVDVMHVKRAFSKYKVENPLHVARDGVEGLDLLRGTNGYEALSPRPDIVLLDINMPRMGGHEFLEEIRKDDDLKSMSVFILTTSEADIDMKRAYNQYAAGYIVKPVDFSKFFEATQSLHHGWQFVSE